MKARAPSSLTILRLSLIIMISIDGSKLNVKLIRKIQMNGQNIQQSGYNVLVSLNLSHHPKTMKPITMSTSLTTSTPRTCVKSNWKSFAFLMSIKGDRKIQIYTKFVSKLNQFLGKCIQAWTLSFNTDLTTQSAHVNFAISSQGLKTRVVGYSRSLDVHSLWL